MINLLKDIFFNQFQFVRTLIYIGVFFLSLSSYGDQADPPMAPADVKVERNEDAMVLLQSSPAYCAQGGDEKDCEKNFIYEKGSKQIHILLVDNRKHSAGSYDINKLLRAPASYGGSIQSLDLMDLFSLGEEDISSLSIRIKKNQKLLIKLGVNGKILEKEVSI